MRGPDGVSQNSKSLKESMLHEIESAGKLILVKEICAYHYRNYSNKRRGVY